MAKFTKKPVTIEAVRLEQSLDSISEAVGFILGSDNEDGYTFGDMVASTLDAGHLIIDTLEGKMKASYGDWIIKGVAGEFYPCKPEIFEATYDPELDYNYSVITGTMPNVAAPLLTHFQDHTPYIFKRSLMARSKTGQDLLDSEWAEKADGHLVLDFSPSRATGYVYTQEDKIAVFAEWCTELI